MAPPTTDDNEEDRKSAASLIHGLTNGAICGFLAIVQSAGFGLLLLSADAQSLVPTAIGMALFSTAVMAAVGALTSSTPGVVAIAQGIPIAALAGPVGAIIAQVGGDAAGAATTATVVVAVGLTSVAIGAAAYLLGVFSLGRFVRFVPFPVIGGFLAGSGWLILLGGISVVAGPSVSLIDTSAMAEPASLLRFGTAAVFLLLPFALARMGLPVSLIIPVVALATMIVFNLIALLGGNQHGNVEGKRLAGRGCQWRHPMAAGRTVRARLGRLAGNCQSGAQSARHRGPVGHRGTDERYRYRA